MNIHEHQAKKILKDYGAPVSNGIVIFAPEEIKDKIKLLKSKEFVLKAQIHAGGRGKAGGVKLVRNLEELNIEAVEMFGKILKTHQTGPNGKEVKRLYVEEASDISKEFYLSCLVDRESSKVAFISSTEGGMDIEKVAKDTPNKIITTGQGGAVVTNDKSIFKIILRLKDQGRVGPTTGGEDNYVSTGYNFKFTNLQATLGLCQLDSINKRVKILKNHYLFYKKNIKQNDNFKLFNFDLKSGEVPLWIDAFCTKRNKLSKFLESKNVFCRYFWQPINTCQPYKESFSKLKNSKDLQKKLIWLPSSLKMKKADLLKVCKLINQFIGKNF